MRLMRLIQFLDSILVALILTQLLDQFKGGRSRNEPFWLLDGAKTGIKADKIGKDSDTDAWNTKDAVSSHHGDGIFIDSY